MTSPKNLLIMVAGGKGTRMQNTLPKQFLSLHGKTILEHSLQAFLSSNVPFDIVIATHKDYISETEILIHKYQKSHTIHIVEGGKERFHSTQNALAKVDAHYQWVFVHDAVRCLITPVLVENLYHHAVQWGSAVPCIPVRDTIREVVNQSSKTLKREHLFMVQTPQVFSSQVLIKAFQQSFQSHFTDEASVVESIGEHISIAQGDPNNIKITYPQDIELAKQLLK